MSFDLEARIDFELNQLRNLLTDGRGVIDSSLSSPPDATGRWALGAILHAFYNGIENIFKQISSAFNILVLDTFSAAYIPMS